VRFVCGNRARHLSGTVGDARTGLGEAVAGEAVLEDIVILRPAGRVSRIAETGKGQTTPAVAQESVVRNEGVLHATLETVKVVIAECVARDRRDGAGDASPGTAAQVRPGGVFVDEVSGERRCPRAGGAVVDVVNPVDKETSSSTRNIAIEDTVIGEEEAVKVVVVQVEQGAGTGLAAPIDFVLVRGDIEPRVVQEYPVACEAEDPVVQNLKVVDGTSVRQDSSSSARERKPVDN
jgi:hypothetical protein